MSSAHTITTAIAMSTATLRQVGSTAAPSSPRRLARPPVVRAQAGTVAANDSAFARGSTSTAQRAVSSA
jgi:hypothetical protein